MKPVLFCLFLFCCFTCSAQTPEKAFIKLVEPLKSSVATRVSKQFLVGSTCKTCSLTINNQAVKVYPTGAFAYEINLAPGDTSFLLSAQSTDGKPVTKNIGYTYTLAPPPDTVKTTEIASIETFPEGNLFVQAGDHIKIKVKALPGATVTANGNISLYEVPGLMPGIYQGEYIIRESDSFQVRKFNVQLTDKTGKSVYRESKYWVSVFSPQAPNVAVTKGRLSHLLFGLGEDRLGGAKIGYLDSLVQLNITGKVGSQYKVQLSKYRSAYIDDEYVSFLPKGTFTPESLTTNFRAWGDEKFDYVSIGLSTRLPYQSMQLVDPSKIVVDVFGATSNTNWIIQMENVKEIKNVFYEQIEDGVLRVTIELNHRQHWGHALYYNRNNLVIKVKRQPEKLSLANLTIGVDAGHGGSNTGAGGPTGSSEKAIALAVSLKLQKALEAKGAKVIMSRSTEIFFDNKERILFYRDSTPDLLLSIHLNSSADPICTGGTSAYYRYIGFRGLSQSIYKRMLELGLKEYGNVGSFNFMLNSPIEYPNALIETLFISNPEEELLILDESFQQRMVDKIVAGIEDFLKQAGKPG